MELLHSHIVLVKVKRASVAILSGLRDLEEGGRLDIRSVFKGLCSVSHIVCGLAYNSVDSSVLVHEGRLLNQTLVIASVRSESLCVLTRIGDAINGTFIFYIVVAI